MNFQDMEVELLDVMGSDLTVVNAARVSMDKFHDELEEGDAKLINYLAKNGHWSPFAHPQLSFRITAPIFVARQLAKHQVGLSWNEVSRRYVDSEPSFYLPEARARASNVKQGSLDREVMDSDIIRDRMKLAMESALRTYKYMLDKCVAPEIARTVLPQNAMTSWVWTGSLYAFFRVVKLRLDSHAQKESRLIAYSIADSLMLKFPLSYCALRDNEMNNGAA